MEASIRPFEAARFLERGRALLGSVVPVSVSPSGRRDDPDSLRINGVRLTPELVLTLAPPGGGPGTCFVGAEPAEQVWFGPGGPQLCVPMVLRVARYSGALPELALGHTAGPVSLVYVSPSRAETLLSFGRVPAGTRTHDATRESGAMGAPLFDTDWSVVGLHHSRREGPYDGEFSPIAELLRALEDAPCWSEIARVQRLVRTRPTPTKSAHAPAPDLARAVRWDPDEEEPLSSDKRRRFIRGATLEALRAARGDAPATSPEQRAVDRVLAGPPFALGDLPDDEVLAFGTAARWFREVVPGLPDPGALDRYLARRRRLAALSSIVGAHFAPRTEELDHLRAWLADRDRAPLVLRGPGGIGKSALLACFVKDACPPARFAWVDFDRVDVFADAESIDRVVDEHLSWQTERGTLLLVLDSFETAVQSYGYGGLVPALDALARRFPDLAVVAGSRSSVPLLTLEGRAAEEYELAGLPPDVSTRWLVEEGIRPDLAARAAELANGVPLNLRLARDLLEAGDDAEEALAGLPKHLVTGYLYRRILRRLKAPDLEKVAPWAMVPRRLVPALLADLVDALEPGAPPGPGADRADRLFAALREEVTLLDGDGGALVVRPDLRNTLLPLLCAEDAARVERIDRAAARFWSSRATTGLVAAAEAVYHSLRLGDLGGADALWLPGIGRWLRGYTAEELPAEARSWLQARVSEGDAAERMEDLLARGRLAEARAVVVQSGRSATAVSRGARVRRLLGALPGVGALGGGRPDPGALLGDRLDGEGSVSVGAEEVEALRGRLDEDDGALDDLEALILPAERPVLDVRRGTYDRPRGDKWGFLGDLGVRALVEAGARAVGRLELAGSPPRVLGTATVVGDGLVLTTRSAVEPFVVGVGHDVRLVPGRHSGVELRAEAGTGPNDVCPVERVVLVHPYWDIAVLGIASVPVLPVPLATSMPEEGALIVSIGHPAPPGPDLAHIGNKVLGGVYDIKRLMPGKLGRLRITNSRGQEVLAGSHDASTICPDPGAALLDPASGRLLGVQFANNYLDANLIVPAWELARDPLLWHAGVRFDGPPPPEPAAWASAWSVTADARGRLLDAYVAWRERDFARVEALLELVPAKGLLPRDAMDHTLLRAAVLLERDPNAAGDLLERLVPPQGWGDDPDILAVAATRLRLAVDTEAERAFLGALRERPDLAGLLTPWQFHVFAAPEGDFPWNRCAAALEHAARTGDTKELEGAGFPEVVLALAMRIARANHGCERFHAWTDDFGGWGLAERLASRMGPVEARALFAGRVGMPTEGVGNPEPYLFEKLGIDPHPVHGWAPVLGPLLGLFRAAGSAPDGVSAEADVQRWLTESHASGNLGGLLARHLAVRSPTPWVAGLYHLLTPLPLEALLERHFTGSEK